MRDDREDPLDPPPSPTLGATAESDARVDALIARVLREGQDDDGLLAEDDEEDEDTRDAPSPAALTTPPQKRRNTAPPAAFAKRQTPTIHARKYAPASRALPQHPTQSPGRKLLGFEVARQYTCPGDVGGHGWTKGVVTAFHDDDEHWGETYGVSMEGRSVYQGRHAAEMTLTPGATRGIVLPAGFTNAAAGLGPGSMPDSSKWSMSGSLLFLGEGVDPDHPRLSAGLRIRGKDSEPAHRSIRGRKPHVQHRSVRMRLLERDGRPGADPVIGRGVFQRARNLGSAGEPRHGGARRIGRVRGDRGNQSRIRRTLVVRGPDERR